MISKKELLRRIMSLEDLLGVRYSKREKLGKSISLYDDHLVEQWGRLHWLDEEKEKANKSKKE